MARNKHEDHGGQWPTPTQGGRQTHGGGEIAMVQPDYLSFQFIRHCLLLTSPTLFGTSCFNFAMEYLILSYDPVANSNGHILYFTQTMECQIDQGIHVVIARLFSYWILQLFIMESKIDKVFVFFFRQD